MALRVWPVDASERGGRAGSSARIPPNGKRRYCSERLREDVPSERLVEYAHRRHWVEQYHGEAKGLLGWDQYQGRLWPGFHRHAVTVMLARAASWCGRSGSNDRSEPARPATATTPGSTSDVAAGGASADHRLASP